MRQYRPNVERQKLLYAQLKSGTVTLSHQDFNKVQIWLPGGVRQVSDAMMISDWLKDKSESFQAFAH
ncbi:MAG: hypothetical protein ACKOAS_00035 [Verrucomicrobiota bacterium]